MEKLPSPRNDSDNKSDLFKRSTVFDRRAREDRLLMFHDGELALYKKKPSVDWRTCPINQEGSRSIELKGDKNLQLKFKDQNERDSWLTFLRDARRLENGKETAMRSTDIDSQTREYDIVIDIDSLLDLDQGWNVHCSKAIVERADLREGLPEAEQERRLSTATLKAIVSVLGLFNKGKTYLLNKLCNENLDSGLKVTTKGLSFKEPKSMNNYIMLDTAGTSSPLRVNKANCTLSVKKSTEDFLQKMAFMLSDVIIVVVNEMTWPDQEYISALAMHWEDKERRTLSYIIVVHNFKDTESEQDFLDMRQKFCVNCFVGHKRVESGVEWFDSNEGVIRHVFLAKDGSPAGVKFNQGTLTIIKSWLTAATLWGQEPIIPRFRKQAQQELSMYFTGVDSLRFAVDYSPPAKVVEQPQNLPILINTNVDWMNNSTANFDAEIFTPFKIRATPREGRTDLGFINNQIFYEGFHVALANTVFRLKYDLVVHKNYIVVAFDCAGINFEVERGGIAPTGPWIRAGLVVTNNQLQLVVKGNKLLAFPEDPNDRQSYNVYVPAKEGQVVQTRQLPEGSFSQSIDIPTNYRADLPPRTILCDGKFFVYIERNTNLDAHP